MNKMKVAEHIRHMNKGDQRKKDPLVSVIIPTYNRAESVQYSIESVLNQTFANLELIVVDDASTDHTEEVVRGYPDQRVRYIRHQTNKGVSGARNTGIEAARGKYIGFLDSADYWLPTKLEQQVDLLESQSSELVAVYCDFADEDLSTWERIIDFGKDRFFRNPSQKSGGEEVIPELLQENLRLGAGSVLLVQRELLNRSGGFDERLKIHEDWDLVIRLLQEGTLHYLDDTLVIARKSTNSSGKYTADQVVEAKRQYLANHSELIKRLEQQGYNILSTQRTIIAGYYLREGRFRTGFNYLDRSTMLSPKNTPRILLWVLIGLHS